MREEITKERVEKLEKIITTELEKNNVNDENLVNNLMFNILVFSIENNYLNQHILHDFAWKYFNKSKNEIMTKIP